MRPPSRGIPGCLERTMTGGGGYGPMSKVSCKGRMARAILSRSPPGEISRQDCAQRPPTPGQAGPSQGHASTGSRSTPAAASIRSWTSTRSRLAACRLGAWYPPPGGMGDFQGENMKRLGYFVSRLISVSLYGYLIFLALTVIGGLAVIIFVEQPFRDMSFDLNALIGWFRGIQLGVYIMFGILFLIMLWDSLHFDAMNKRQNQVFEAIANDFEIAGKEIEKLRDRLRELEDEISDLRQ